MRTIPARPYPWPYHAAPHSERTALLVFSDACATGPLPAVTQRLARLITAARERRIVVIALPPLDGRAVFPLASVAADLVIPRPHFGAFAGTHLDTILRRRRLTDLLIAGFPFELSADCTMREANDRGYECLLLSDCTGATDHGNYEAAVKMVTMQNGVFGAVSTSAALLAALEPLAAGVAVS